MRQLYRALAALLLPVGLCAQGQEPVRFYPVGAKLPGPQLQYDAGFEVLDWNGDGKPDLFLPNTSMMAFTVHLNEGTATKPSFGHAVGYPVNLTETEPQTIEHCQSMALGDLNGDGMFDLICFDGKLRWVPNTGTPHGPDHWHLAKLPPHYFPGNDKMIEENARFSTGPESMFWNKGIFARQVLTMTVADWDGDGLPDLLICRFKEEAPGVKPAGGSEQWTAWGRLLISKPSLPPPPADAPKFLDPLTQAPPRGLYFYKNVGTRQKPAFDKGVEIRTADDQSIAAPNPVVADIDGDGILDVLSCETAYSCNAFRVDWPTNPSVVWFRRVKKEDGSVVEASRPVLDAKGQPIAAGVQARFADLRNAGVQDLLVMDAGLKGSIRWYPNQAAAKARPAFGVPEVLTGRDFLRFDFMSQPLVVDWFGKDTRDLIVHGNTDAHCKWSLRRTALYRNRASKPGELTYEFAGLLNYRGDPRMVEPQLEERPYDVYGSAVWLMPEDGTGKKRLMMSVDGKLYLFTNLATDGLTFQERRALNLPARRNRHRGWQEIAVNVPDKVQHLRIGNDRNGMGNLRDSFLHVVKFEALSAGKNWTTLAEGVTVGDENDKIDAAWYRVQRPKLMFTPENQPSDVEPRFSTFGYYIGPAVITLKQPVAIDKIRFLLSDREERWYNFRLPFYWQGKLHRDGTEQGEPWYQYKVEVSADKKKWTTVADTMPTEMMRSFPCLVDWDGDGKCDLILGVLNSQGIYPVTKEFRLYRNTGTNDDPRFDRFTPLADDNGKPLVLQAEYYLAYGLQCGVIARDLDGDGKVDLVIDGFRNADLVYYRNVSKDAKEPRFKLVQSIGSPRPIHYPSGYRYFYVGDVDGDGIADLINSANSSMAFFKGTLPTAPARVEDLSVVKSDAAGVELRWSRPKGATRYELRWSDQPITELTWPRLTGQAMDYKVDEGKPHSVVLSSLPTGRTVHLALKSFNDKRQAAPLSDSVEAVGAPLRRIILRNGPDSGPELPAYKGNDACYVDAQKPGDPSPRKPCCLIARAPVPRGEKQKAILVRFKDLPKDGTLERAVLELTTDPSIQENPAFLQGMAALAISCNVIRDDWLDARATFVEAAPGKPWSATELDAGGTFVAMAKPNLTIGPRRTLQWDVTAALRAARKEGRDSLSLLVRVDNTGAYIAGQGYSFCAADFPAVEQRPRLCLTVSPGK